MSKVTTFLVTNVVYPPPPPPPTPSTAHDPTPLAPNVAGHGTLASSFVATYEHLMIILGSSHFSDFKIGTPVATPLGAQRYGVSAGTGWLGVSIL